MWLPAPGTQTSDSGMGHSSVTVEVGDRDAERFVSIKALVDTGATYPWIPRRILEGLGVTPEENWPFLLADGREVRYPVAWTQIRIRGHARPTIVVFGEPGSEPILGVVSLEIFGLAVDPLRHGLIPVPAHL